MDIFVVETFQYDWNDKKITSQYLLVTDMESGKKIVTRATRQESENGRKTEIIIDEPDRYIVMIHVPNTDLTSESEYFIGCTQRHVNSPDDVDELLRGI